MIESAKLERIFPKELRMAKRVCLGLLIFAAVGVLVSCGSGGGSSSANISVSVSEASATVDTGQTDQFMAVVTGTTNMAVTWEVNGVAGGNATVGTITSAGLFTAPATVPNPAKVTITAVSQADSSKSGAASVTIKQAVIVTISPQPACDPFGSSSPNVQTFGTLQFSATVTGNANTKVTWQVNGVTGGGPATGAINTSGLFTAPNSVPTMASGGGSVTACVTIKAVSQADSSASASATLQITSKNQQAETVPVQMGASGGNVDDSSPVMGGIECCGGTLGSLVTSGGTQFILSNNHVLARSDQAVIKNNEPIIQPGLIDAPSPCTTGGTTQVGTLSNFFNLETSPGTKIDAAIAKVTAGTVDPTGSIEELGATTDPVTGIPVAAPPASTTVPVTSALMGRQVAKSGRSTGITCANVGTKAGSINATIMVTYQRGCGTGTTFSETFTDEIVIDSASFSAEGDSGSLIVTADTAQPVALLFAGDSSSTVGNPIADVLNFFKASFVPAPTHKVIACTLPGPATGSQATVKVPDTAMKQAADVRDRHAPELLSIPAVVAAGLGGSLDAPGEAAIVLFVQKGAARGSIPAEVEGIRTRIIEGENFSIRGSISEEESSRLISQMPAAAIHLTEVQGARAIAIKEKHVGELMSDPAIQGVGVTASLDSPGEAALIIYILRGKPHKPIPITIDGLRTRVKETTGFHAGWTKNAPRPHHGCPAPSGNPAPGATKPPQP